MFLSKRIKGYIDNVLGIPFIMTKGGLSCGISQNPNSIWFYVFHERQKGTDDFLKCKNYNLNVKWIFSSLPPWTEFSACFHLYNQ